ncbi:hypothetical protein WKW79_31860 [Variovorax robiniae]|uniref:SGNH hydrolase-type esterase domain-containing protein n=1 Tax=Variovorax robiniae TaxID=1836199 RepID=A0ABU8XH50_9BURK
MTTPFALIQPSSLNQGSIPGAPFYKQFLAQGDSWFSIGALPFSATTNLLYPSGLDKRAGVVNCADPGFTLEKMLDRMSDPVFQQLLCGAMEYQWDGILISGLGNDVIHALSAKASEPQERRLLATAVEWGDSTSPSRYISELGWTAFEKYAMALYQDLDRMRHASKLNKATPIITHTYDLATPRNAPAGPSGPWLYKALTAYSVPSSDWCPLADELLGRLSDLICDISTKISGMHVVKTQGTLTPAPEGSTGKQGHWENEIHPSPAGYRLLAKKFSAELQLLFP